MEVVCAEVHKPMLQSLGADKLALLAESMCILGGRLRFSQQVDFLLGVRSFLFFITII